jgi:hypothetical protein
MSEFIPAALVACYLGFGAFLWLKGGGPEDVASAWRSGRRKGAGMAVLSFAYVAAWPLCFMLPGD